MPAQRHNTSMLLRLHEVGNDWVWIVNPQFSLHTSTQVACSYSFSIQLDLRLQDVVLMAARQEPVSTNPEWQGKYKQRCHPSPEGAILNLGNSEDGDSDKDHQQRHR